VVVVTRGMVGTRRSMAFAARPRVKGTKAVVGLWVELLAERVGVGALMVWRIWLSGSTIAWSHVTMIQ
jgi:hypothetical protein